METGATGLEPARLNEVAPADWLLKGGFAHYLRLADRARATRDVDLDWQADEEELDRGCFACALGGPDGQTVFMIAQEWSRPARRFEGQTAPWRPAAMKAAKVRA